MGSACGIIKAKEELDQVVIPVKNKRHLQSAPPPDEKAAQIGKYFTEIEVAPTKIRRWQKILILQESMALKNPAKLRKQITVEMIKGIPNEYRWRCWVNLLLKTPAMSEEAYNNLPQTGEPHIITIKRDLDRSFPYEAYFDKEKFGEIGQAALERILSKFAEKHQEIGYCQGMNFIVGFLLIVSGGSEIEVFCCFEVLCKDFGMEGFYIEGMGYLKKCIWVTKKLMEKYKKKLSDHFAGQGLPDDLWLLKWLMTAFTMVLSGNVLVRVWDLFLVERIKVLYQVTLAILTLLEPELIEKDTGDMAEYISDVKSKIKDPEEFIKLVLSFKIKKNILEQLEKSFDFEYRVLNKEKNTATSEDTSKLPPLKLSPMKMKSVRPNNIDSNVVRNLNDCFSPSKLTTVPALPSIRRCVIKRQSFGITNRSCEISLNPEKSE